MATVAEVRAQEYYARLLHALTESGADAPGLADELAAAADETGLTPAQLQQIELDEFRAFANSLWHSNARLTSSDLRRLELVAEILHIDTQVFDGAVSKLISQPETRLVPDPSYVPPVAPMPQVAVQVNVSVPATNVVVMSQADGAPSFLIRAIWFLFIGWWLTFWWIAAAWVLNLTIVGLPLGLMMINRVPTVLTLQSQKKRTVVTQQGSTTLIRTADVEQRSFLLRAIYFVLVGWWASLAVAIVAWGLSILIITLPLGLLMFNFLPQVTTLRRN